MIDHIHHIQIRNYKSIAGSVVELCPFTVLVGPNGSGKSNFVEALAFVQECLSGSIDLAFKNRGGIAAVRRRSGGHPTHIGIGLSMTIGECDADYSFEIAAHKGAFIVARERCLLSPFLGEQQGFYVEQGQFLREIPGIRPKLTTDRLALFAASATEEFSPVYDFLTSMRFYSIVPERLRELEEPDSGEILRPDGSNAASVLKRIERENGEDDRYNRICRLLSKVADGIRSVQPRLVGTKETMQFKQTVAGQKHPWKFDALNMSDGTLRVLGLLLAVYQTGLTSLVAVEEPEATVHPAIAEMVTEVLLDASLDKQVLITTHSPDILDYKNIRDEQIRVVTIRDGVTKVSPVSEAGRAAIRERLYTPGELLKLNELTADIEKEQEMSEQLQLFGNMHAYHKDTQCPASE